MGNSLSAEAPWKGHRTSQKLSKPKTGNPTAAGLLSTNGASHSARPPPTTRRLSLPPTSTPSASPMLPETDPAANVKVSSIEKGTELGYRLSRKIFRFNASKESFSRRQRSRSVEVSSSQQERWAGNVDTVGNVSVEGYSYDYNQTSVQASLSVDGSRTSLFNYDLGSYEATRLLSLAKQPSYEDNLLISGNQIHISDAMRSDMRHRRPSIPEATPLPLMVQDTPDLSLYTPMRRRSLMTPGVATREASTDPDPSKRRTRHSLPSTPARRESMESAGIDRINLSLPLTTQDPIPRALTPCEAEYKQTGAFKLGTLRITNGSPSRSPVREPGASIEREHAEQSMGGGMAGSHSREAQVVSGGRMGAELSSAFMGDVEVQNNADCLSPSKIFHPNMVASTYSTPAQRSPQFPLEDRAGPLIPDEKSNIRDIQVTSKNMAVEDNLFDIEQNEYSSDEVLDVRIDTNAKSLPPRPKLASDISRSDSGIASPASEYSSAPLSKADSGYSSSVSLRSFSSRPPAPEKERASDANVEVTSDTCTKQSIHTEETEPVSPAAMTTNIIVSETFDESSPPPVPTKDPHLVGLASPKACGELSPSFQQTSPTLFDAPRRNREPERTLSPRSTRGQTVRTLEIHKASLRNPISPNSGLNVSTSFRKSGKLQRFLSGGRTPPTIHNSYPTKSTSLSTSSGGMQARIQARTGLSPASFRKLALRSAASKETLGTILSVGSAELLQDDDVSSKALSSQLGPSDRGRGTPASIESAVSYGSSPVFSKKPIKRKPVPVRSDNSSVRSPGIVKTTTGNEFIQATPSHARNGEFHGHSPVISTTGERYSAYAPRQPRSSTAAGHIEGDPRRLSNRRSYELTQDKSRSATSLELPPAIPSSRFSKSPPPVSMRTRNMGPLRVPPPGRSRSTPPESMGRPGLPPYSRERSRDGNLRSPEYTGGSMTYQTGRSRNPSRESLRGPPAQIPHYADKPSAMTTANNPRSTKPGAESVGPRVPNWDVQADHGPSFSPRSSSDYSRRSSFASESSQRSAATTGPIFFRQQHHSQPNLPLRRRSSYDEYNLVPQNSCIRDNGPYPSISRDGLAYVTDPWSGRPLSMPRQWDDPLGQPIRHPPYPPRHHTRHRSMDQYGNPTPYRVLHSYNSPAYRNVPIWR